MPEPQAELGIFRRSTMLSETDYQFTKQEHQNAISKDLEQEMRILNNHISFSVLINSTN